MGQSSPLWRDATFHVRDSWHPSTGANRLAGNEGMTPIFYLLWLPLRESLRSFPTPLVIPY